MNKILLKTAGICFIVGLSVSCTCFYFNAPIWLTYTSCIIAGFLVAKILSCIERRSAIKEILNQRHELLDCQDHICRCIKLEEKPLERLGG